MSVRKGLVAPSASSTPPPPQRRTSNPLPGISATACSLRHRCAGTKTQLTELPDDSFDEETPGESTVNVKPKPSGPASLLRAALIPAKQATVHAPCTTGQLPQAPTNRFRGTPSRSTRYSLPVRAEKPVRTTKTSGKHVLLPSESQLAPLPSELQQDDDDESDSEVDDQPNAPANTDKPVLLGARGAVEAVVAAKPPARMPVSAPRAGPTIPTTRRKPIPPAPGKLVTPPSTKGTLRPAASTALARAAASSAGRTIKQDAASTFRAARITAPPLQPLGSGSVYHTFERMPPSMRVMTPLPRVTAYSISSSIHLGTLLGFLRREHGVKPRLYDECAYAVYTKPLLPGFGRANVRSAPEPRSASPGAESRRERELEERDEFGYIGTYFENRGEEEEDIDPDGYIKGGEGRGSDSESRHGRREGDWEGEAEQAKRWNNVDRQAETQTENGRQERREVSNVASSLPEDEEALTTPLARPVQVIDRRGSGSDMNDPDSAGARDMLMQQISEERDGPNMDVAGSYQSTETVLSSEMDEPSAQPPTSPTQLTTIAESSTPLKHRRRRRKRTRAGPNTASHNHDTSANLLTPRLILEALQSAELIILPYGVLVMYNFTSSEESSIIEDVLSSGCAREIMPSEDREVEAFHFCYDPAIPAPRIFNDFFTFRAPDHLLKLSLAHAIAQSTKLSVFEERMQNSLEVTSHIPKEMASTGELKLKRREALRLTGRLFKLRVDVNLTSNVLDTPELFWSEASLKLLYDAIRDYLEIDERVENLNERLAVANDLLEIIHEHIANTAMSKITWIVIILIVVACAVAVGEISARFIVGANRSSEALFLQT